MLLSNVLDGTEENCLWDNDDKGKADSPDSDWNPYNDAITSTSKDYELYVKYSASDNEPNYLNNFTHMHKFF